MLVFMLVLVFVLVLVRMIVRMMVTMFPTATRIFLLLVRVSMFMVTTLPAATRIFLLLVRVGMFVAFGAGFLLVVVRMGSMSVVRRTLFVSVVVGMRVRILRRELHMFQTLHTLPERGNVRSEDNLIMDRQGLEDGLDVLGKVGGIFRHGWF